MLLSALDFEIVFQLKAFGERVDVVLKPRREVLLFVRPFSSEADRFC